MKMKSLVAVLLLSLGISACSTLEKVVYRIDVPQGNYLEQDKIDLLQVGMNKEQVNYVLGTPLLNDMFEKDRWDYVFIKREGHNDPIQHLLQIYFDSKGLVSEIKLDNPIVAEQKQEKTDKKWYML
ncbi:outer membrane protein assembly factor BamE [Otariodibacter oris]|uniref:Outer membrane protein assembly factor BamE n=1 Tax=Otariodibacter oris TaxID=1032623 RepID=A0A420XFK4_9PAST|nr:outer membrane protein assembly factor BamE [Otariodibacter oris]QGM80242.1 membrane biogenesis protein [Otariodibacter oris]RKR71605.1 Beta-barrel assembly machine subunit BamE [Otariodibacter oris]